ncbi:MAG: PEP-CTERM sorting domain-containing protein [Clostridia bacterium]|nr:PEP-CTERM sorting domain-containing protein [Clostridia bacterium]
MNKKSSLHNTHKIALSVLAGMVLCAPVSAEMVGFWNYDAGNAVNSVTGTADLNIVNTKGTTGVSFADGIYTSDGTSYLRGTGTNYTIANLPTGASAYTISSYVQTPTKANHGIVGWGTYGSTKRCNALRTFNGEYDDGTNPGFRHYWWGGDLTPVYNNTWNAHPFSEDWYHIVSTSNGTNQNLYINGQLIGSANPGGHNMQNQNFTIGSTNNNNKEILIGSMDNTSVYSHELSHGDVVNLTIAPNIGMTGWWVDSDTISGNQKADRLTGKVWSESLEASAKTVIKGNGNTMLFDRVLNAKENAYFTGQIAAGHTYQMDAEVSAWTNTNTAWVRTKSLTYDGSTTPLGIHVGGTTTAVTLTATGANLNKTNLVTILPGGTLNVSNTDNFSTTLYINGGTLKGGNIRSRDGGEIIMNSGKIEHSQLRLGHGGTNGSFTLNGGQADVSFFIMGEVNSAVNSLVTVNINGGTLNSYAINNDKNVGIVIGRGSKGIFNLNGGTVNASGVTTYTKGAIHIGPNNVGILNMTGGELNVSGDGLYIEFNGSAVNQSGGVANITSTKGLTINKDSAYNLSGGFLNVHSITNNAGAFTQTGGKLSGTGESLTLKGNYSMNGGLLGSPLTVTGNAAVNAIPGAITSMTVNGELTGGVLDSKYYTVTKNGNASVIAPSAYSQEMLTDGTYVWGGGTGNYDQANTNWVQNGAYVETVPGKDSRVIIASGQVNMKTNAQAGEVYLSSATMAYPAGTFTNNIGKVYVGEGGVVTLHNNTLLNGTDFVIDGGTVKNGRFFTGHGTDTVLNSGKIEVNELRVGNEGTEGSLTVNGGTVTTGWLAFGEIDGSQPNAKSTVTLNDGTITAQGNTAVIVSRGGKGDLIINGGTFNASGTSSATKGALNIGSHNESSSKITGGTLNVSGKGLYIGKQSGSGTWSSTFTQEGGSVNIGSGTNITLGEGGSYIMTGGRLNTPSIIGSTNENLQITGGLLSPGGKGQIAMTHVTGDITLGGDSAFEVTIGKLQADFTDSSDILAVDGTLTLDSLLVLDIIDTLNTDDEYLILASKNPIQSNEYGSAEAWAFENAVNGIVLTVAENPNLLEGYNYVVTARFGEQPGDGVPEPAAWVLLVLGCGILFWRKKKTAVLPALALSCVLTGCGGPGYPVCTWEGSVNLKGEPVPSSATATITVSSTDAKTASRSVSAPIVDGKYVLENVPQGEVLVQFNIVQETPAKNPEDAARGMTDVKNLMPRKFKPFTETANGDETNKNFEIE